MKLENSLTLYTKINSKWVKDLNVRPDTIKLLRGKHRHNTLWHKNLSKNHYNPPPRVMEIKTKMNKWELIKLKSFGIAKETINKKTAYRMGENIGKHVTNKGLISKMY